MRHGCWQSERGDPGRSWIEIEIDVWRRTERDLQVLEEDSVVFSNIEVGDKHAGNSGLGDLEVTECIYCTQTPRAVGARGRRTRPKLPD